MMSLLFRHSRQSVYSPRSKVYNLYTYWGFISETGEVTDFVVRKGGLEIAESAHNRLLFERFRDDLRGLAKHEFEAARPKERPGKK